MDKQLKSNLTSSKLWVRLLYMIFFAICLQVARFVVWVLVCLQFLFALVTGSENANLRSLGLSLSDYIYQALKFLTYNTDAKPFPFADWPKTQDNQPLEGELQVAGDDVESSTDDEGLASTDERSDESKADQSSDTDSEKK